jgi:hypothetical protein
MVTHARTPIVIILWCSTMQKYCQLAILGLHIKWANVRLFVDKSRVINVSSRRRRSILLGGGNGWKQPLLRPEVD